MLRSRDEPDLAAAVSVLRDRFGHSGFRAGQGPIVASMVAGRDVLAVLPTGAGKSVCYQVPAMLTPGPTLIVSPLIALMEDQVTVLRRNGIAAAALTSVASSSERRLAEALLTGRGPALVYAAPERLVLPAFRQSVARAPITRLVVDEAHCISEWGHDFRPSYRTIGAFARAIGGPPVAAFTATATPATRDDIARQLGLRNPASFVAPVDRRNLRWEVVRARRASDAAWQLGEAVRRRGSGAALVYVPTRALAAGLAAALRRQGQPAIAYHAGLSPARRAAAQHAFLSDPRGVVCATCAFGMGIDHPHVRLVAHLGMPGALEAYVQEAGRAGRDGAPSRCLLVRLPTDLRLHRGRVRELPRGARRFARRRLVGMRAYATEHRCRRRAIAVYFGENPPVCAGCDLCDRR